MLRSPLARWALAAATLATSVSASSCVVFDSDFNLYALNVGGADYNLGTSSDWAGGSAKALTTTGRPPFTGSNLQCFLSQYENSFYLLDADASNPTDVYIYSAASSSWSTQKTTDGGADLTNMVAILDHDTNVFFGLSGGTLYQADFGQQTAATSTAIEWQVVGTPSFSTSNYSPVMALAQNHIHFLDVPGASAGDAYIFVIHFAFFQPAVQSYPASSGNTFPATHGKTASFFNAQNNVQQQFAFIPDDGSATYVINVETNTTLPMAGPTDKSSGAIYAASATELVQLTSSGKMYYLPFDQSSPSATSTWSAISVSGISTTNNTTSTTASGSSTTTGTGTTKMVTSTAGGSSTHSATSSPTTTSKASGASALGASSFVAGALALIGMALAL
ncbi:hypothetical protein DL93DRAFT_2057245 [Clavulina sp. PMI_390]|nr:hypothetical protein DL93DRAFT_2057245 [Clavulina sp. PMI_390]